MKLTEKAIESAIVRNLRALGLIVVKFSQPRRTMQTEGTPDLLVLSPRWTLHLFVEVKRPGGKLRPAQAVWHRDARASGLNVVVAYGIADVLAELKRLGLPLTT